MLRGTKMSAHDTCMHTYVRDTCGDQQVVLSFYLYMGSRYHIQVAKLTQQALLFSESSHWPYILSIVYVSL